MRTLLIRSVLTVALIPLLPLLAAGPLAQARKHLSLETSEGLKLHNVTAVPTTLLGKKGLKLTTSDEAGKRLEAMTPEERGKMPTLAVIEGVEFANGVIEAEIAGAPAPGAPELARGFVGILLRLQDDLQRYDTFYLRPTNARAEDQERRNHSVQYSSAPDWPWFRLRKETPSKYEAYVDMQPNVWTKIKIEVRGERARLYVHDQEQPTLIVNDLKTGASAKGAVALSLDRSTIAHFRNVTVTPQ